MDNIRHEFKEFATFYRDTVAPTLLKIKEYECRIRELLFTKYTRLADNLFLPLIPEVREKKVEKEKIFIDPTFLEIIDVRTNPADISITLFTFKIRYGIIGELEDKLEGPFRECIIRPRIPLRFFSNYIGDEEKNSD